MNRPLIFSLTWDEHSDEQYDIISSPKQQLFKPPVAVGHAPEFASAVSGPPELPPWRMAVFEEAALLGRAGVGVTRTGGLIMETAYDGKLNLYERYPQVAAIVDDVIPGVERLTGTTLSLMHMWWNSYFHWCLEILPRLCAYQEYIKKTGDKPRVLVGSNPPRFVVESLDLLRIPYVRATASSYLCDRLLVPMSARPWGRMYTEAVQWLTDQVLLSSEAQMFVGDRLYVSRAECELRRVLGEDTLQPLLDEYGFRTIYPHHWRFDEQVSVFGSADVVIGGHGGGMLNTLWNDAGTTLVEFFEPSYVNPCIYTAIQARQGNDQYGYVIGEGSAGNVRVSPGQVRTALERLNVQP